MDDHAQEEDFDGLEGLRGEEVVVLVGDTGDGVRREGGGFGAFNRVREVLDDEGEGGIGFREGDAGVAA